MSFVTLLLNAIADERKAWKEEELRAHGEQSAVLQDHGKGWYSYIGSPRLAMVHCHVDGSFDGGTTTKPTKPYAVPTLIASTKEPAGLCPNWPAGLDSVGAHDGGPGAVARGLRRLKYPEALITGLDSAMRLKRNDPWYKRQLVRVLTENGEYARAETIVKSCINDLWCKVLDGYVQHLQGRWSQANAAWERALALMEPGLRCELLTTTELVAFKRDTVTFASCEGRWPLDEKVWWLSKPLLGDSINYRQVEHLARMVRTAMAMDLPRDVYFDLRPALGGDAVSRMRVRYGWPDHAYWGGDETDVSHRGYLQTKTKAPIDPPYLAPEYSRDVVTTTPSMSAAQSPFASQDADFAVEHETLYSDARPWPQEFFRHPNGVLLHISTQQRALLRRDTTALFVAAVTLPSPPASAGPDSTVRFQLLASRNPADIRQLAATNTRWGARTFVSSELREPSVIGLEVNRGGARIAGARMRFGVPIIPSHAASRTLCAVSEPILLSATVLAEAGTGKLQRGMLSDLALRRPEKIGLLWETYGVRAGDSVTLSVKVTGSQDRSGIVRAVQSLGLVGQQEVAIAVSWNEPSPARQVEVIPARTATLRRDLTLDVTSLRSGTYGVQVTMKAKGCDAASPVRQFTVTR